MGAALTTGGFSSYATVVSTTYATEGVTLAFSGHAKTSFNDELQEHDDYDSRIEQESCPTNLLSEYPSSSARQPKESRSPVQHTRSRNSFGIYKDKACFDDALRTCTTTSHPSGCGVARQEKSTQMGIDDTYHNRIPDLRPYSYCARGLVKNVTPADTGGYGGLSNIYRGTLYSSHPIGIAGKLVAAKELRRFQNLSDEDIIRKITREAQLWSRLHHENILPFLGLYESTSDPSQLYLVSEWAPLGNAAQYLNENRDHAPILMKGIIAGIIYLHRGVILQDCKMGIDRLIQLRHLDLKPDNILVGFGPKALICDMGQASEALVGGIAATNTGCVNYLSPELALASCFDDIEARRELYEKADVYAFGLTCYHLMTGQLPFPLPQAQMFGILIRARDNPAMFIERAPQYDAALSIELFRLLQRCWSIDPTTRPTILEFQIAYDGLTCRERMVHIV